ncbi:MAG: thiamine-phosphate kinase, partial [Alphaproteobacteria bacterium]
PMLGEFDLIDRYFAPLAAGTPGAFGLGNDAAVFDPAPGNSVVVTTDAMVEGVHFLPDDPGGLVARKLLRVNLSDLAAMGAAVRNYVLSLALPPKLDETWVAAFADGLRVDQDEFGINLLGGDTVKTPGPLTLALTAFGEVPVGMALTRSGARAGDDIYVSGSIGDGALGLKALRRELAGLAEADRAALADRYHLPRPRLALGQALAAQRLATAALDISDGLVADLGHITAESGLAAEINAAAVPLSPAARAALDSDPALREVILGGGDDYELLFTAPPGAAEAIAALAAALALPVTRIGAMSAGSGVRAVDEAGAPILLKKAGWSHF